MNTISYLTLQKIVALSDSHWKRSHTFNHWFHYEAQQDLIQYFQLSDAHVFISKNSNRGEVIYGGTKWMEELDHSLDCSFILSENLEVTWKNKTNLARMQRMPLKENILYHHPERSRPDGWEKVILPEWPATESYKFMEKTKELIAKSQYVASRNEKDELVSLIIYDYQDRAYLGHYWWARPQNMVKAFQQFCQLHKYFDSQDPMEFNTYCMTSGPSFKLHQLAGYEVREEVCLYKFKSKMGRPESSGESD